MCNERPLTICPIVKDWLQANVYVFLLVLTKLQNRIIQIEHREVKTQDQFVKITLATQTTKITSSIASYVHPYIKIASQRTELRNNNLHYFPSTLLGQPIETWTLAPPAKGN